MAAQLLRQVVQDVAPGTSVLHAAGLPAADAGAHGSDTPALSSLDPGRSVASFSDWRLAASLAPPGSRAACTSALFRSDDGRPAGFAILVTGGDGASRLRLVRRAKQLLSLAGFALAARKAQSAKRTADERAAASKLQRRFLARRPAPSPASRRFFSPLAARTPPARTAARGRASTLRRRRRCPPAPRRRRPSATSSGPLVRTPTPSLLLHRISPTLLNPLS